MLEVELDAEFTCNLIDVLLLSDLFLRHYLHPAKETSFLVDHHHHLAELPLPHPAPNREVCLAELAGFCLYRKDGNLVLFNRFFIVF
jgi:hypothetical protein